MSIINYDELAIGEKGKPIGEMTDEEILEMYNESEKDSTVRRFIDLWMDVNNWKEKYPEYFL